MPKGVYVRKEYSKWGNFQVGDLEDHFWKRVNKLGPVHPVLKTRCWVWIAGYYKNLKGKNTYGQFRNRYAHRFSYEYAKGHIPDGVLVLHRCDNQGCVNPDHLVLGTYQDNMDDKFAKGRQGQSGTKTPCFGSKNGRYVHGRRSKKL